MNEWDKEPSPEMVNRIKELLEEWEHRYDDIEALEYDGARGLPPNWIPKATIWRFRQTRNYFLEDCGYTLDRLAERIIYYSEKGVPPFHMHPNGEPVDWGALNLLLGFLANLKWIVSLGKDEGLKELADIDNIQKMGVVLPTKSGHPNYAHCA